MVDSVILCVAVFILTFAGRSNIPITGAHL